MTVTVPPGHAYRVDAHSDNGDRFVADGLQNDAATDHLTARATTGDVTVRTP